MTSQDSGIETGNDSNDSSYPTPESGRERERNEPRNESSPMKMINFRYQTPASLSSQIQTTLSRISLGFPLSKPSSSNQSDDTTENQIGLKPANPQPPEDVGLPMFRLPNPRSSTLDVEPPAGLSFSNLQPSSLGLGNGYEIIGIGQDFVYRNIELQLKLKAVRCRLRSARDAWTQFKTPLDERKLRRAVSMNNVEQVEHLLASGVNPNSCDAHKRTPLHLAACRGYTEILRLLLGRGADPNKKDALGNTPLHIAACTNNVEVVTLLIKAGTDVSSGDNSGRNPLQIAQSKLKLLQRTGTEDSARVKAEVAQVVEMMQTFLLKRGQEMEVELLNAFSSRLSLSDTPAKVETDVRDLLASLSGLSLGQSSSHE